MKAEKKFRVVIRGLHPETDICEIKRDLADKGFAACDVSNIQIKKKLNPEDKNSKNKRIRLPLFFVDLDPQENNKDIYNLDSLCYHKIKKNHQERKKMCHNIKTVNPLAINKITATKNRCV